MFLLNSRHPLACATNLWLPNGWSLLSRSYESILPSSFNIVISNALVFSTHPPVSVYGTVFACAISWKSFATSVIRYNLNNLRPSSLSSWSWNFNHVPIDYGLRPRLRGRLTLRCLPLRRKPWIFGGEAFHLSLCYSCQHSHF